MRLIPPVLGLAGVGLQAGLTALAGGRRRFPGQRVAAATLATGSFALGGAALGLFRGAGTTSDPLHPDRASTLVTDGVYAHTRNPMYLSILALLLAGTVATGRLRTLIAVPAVMWALQPQLDAEESALAQRFGADYTDYRTRVRRWL